MNRLATFLLVCTLASTALTAQQNVGINVFRGSVTVSGVLCGFNCNDPANVGAASVGALTVIGVRLIGEANMPAAVVFGIGPVSTPCGLVQLPGFHNSLLINPGAIIVGPATAALVGPNRSCGGSANDPVLANFTIPANASGAILTVQGLVFDNGQPTFTRAVDITVQ